MKSFDDFAIGDISLEGFQVIKGTYFSHQVEPYMSFWETSISFNAAAYNALNNVAAVQIMVNQSSRRILVCPSNADETDSIVWGKNLEKPKSSPLMCTTFTRQLYEMWKWKSKTRYRARGKLVKHDRKLMLMFDFSSPEIVPAKAKTI